MVEPAYASSGKSKGKLLSDVISRAKVRGLGPSQEHRK